jgi:hypothetical protein
MLYCNVKPATVATVGNVKAALHVLAGAVNTGAVGNTTKLFVSLHPGVVPEVYVAVKHPAVDGVNTPLLASMVPPPLTAHVPPGAAPVCVNVTAPPPIQELGAVTTGNGLTTTATTLLFTTHVYWPASGPFVFLPVASR